MAPVSLFPRLSSPTLDSLLANSLADTTIRAYSATLKRLRKEGIFPPFSLESASQVLAKAAERDWPVSTISSMRATMVKYNRIRRLPDPFDDPVIEALLQGLKRSARANASSKPSKAAVPASAAAIEAAAVMALDENTPTAQRVQATGLVLGFCFCFRPRTLGAVCPSHWRTLSTYLELVVAHEKTGGAYDQARIIRVALHNNPLVAMLSFVQQHCPADTPVWPARQQDTLVQLLQQLHPEDAPARGLNSLRPGGASCAALFPGGRERVKSIGNWRSDAADLYVRANYIPPPRGGHVEKIMSALYAPAF